LPVDHRQCQFFFPLLDLLLRRFSHVPFSSRLA
jgi:hypothetical protein